MQMQREQQVKSDRRRKDGLAEMNRRGGAHGVSELGMKRRI
jgi:hypothetical protein